MRSVFIVGYLQGAHSTNLLDVCGVQIEGGTGAVWHASESQLAQEDRSNALGGVPHKHSYTKTLAFELVLRTRVLRGALRNLIIKNIILVENAFLAL